MTEPVSDPSYVDIIEAEFGARLGADLQVYSEKLSIFIAHCDREGVVVESIAEWISRAELELARIGGGATSVRVRGAWVNGAGATIREPTTIVYTYASPGQIVASVGTIRALADAYGRATNQGEVAVLLENRDGEWFFRIPVRWR